MFSGRIDRVGFLLGILYLYAPLAVFWLVYSLLTWILHIPYQGSAHNPLMFTLLAIAGIYGLLVIFPGWFGLSVRRWHDADFSGWMALWQFLPYLNVALLLFLLFFPGTKAPNKYGEQYSPRRFHDILFGPKTDNVPPPPPA